MRESAEVMKGLADLLGEIRARTADDEQVEGEVEVDDAPRFWLPTETPDLRDVDAWLKRAPVEREFWVAEMSNPGTMVQFMQNRQVVHSTESEFAAVQFLGSIKGREGQSHRRRA